MTRLREQLEGAIQASIVGLVVAVALVASHIQPWNFPEVQNLRTLALLELGAFALALVVVVRGRPLLMPGLVAVGGFAAFALLSVLLSPQAETTAERGLGFVALLGAAWLLGISAVNAPRVAGHVLVALLAATVVVALLGIYELWHAYGQAVLPATKGQGARYNGIGQNPNQIAMLIAVVLPIGLWTARAWRGAARVAAFAATALLLGSLVASGSRGAVIGAFAGSCAYVLAAFPRRRLLAAAGCVVALVAALGATQIPQPADENPPLYETFGRTPKLSPQDLNSKLPLESEFGFPGESVDTGAKRTLLFSSGRVQAWELAFRQAIERPIVGYGFGTEDETFVDRSYMFVSRAIENSYLGAFLQLGLIGLALLVAAIALPLVAWLRVLPHLDAERGEMAAAAAGVVVAGAVVALPQSYLTAPGSPPTAAFWIALFLLAALVNDAARRRGAVPAAPAR